MTKIPTLVVKERSYHEKLTIMVLFVWAMTATIALYQEIKEHANLSAQFVECLNGTWRASAADGTQVACFPAESNKPKLTQEKEK